MDMRILSQDHGSLSCCYMVLLCLHRHLSDLVYFKSVFILYRPHILPLFHEIPQSKPVYFSGNKQTPVRSLPYCLNWLLYLSDASLFLIFCQGVIGSPVLWQFIWDITNFIPIICHTYKPVVSFVWVKSCLDFVLNFYFCYYINILLCISVVTREHCKFLFTFLVFLDFVPMQDSNYIELVVPWFFDGTGLSSDLDYVLVTSKYANVLFDIFIYFGI